MTLEELAQLVPGFKSSSFADKIRVFAWYVQRHGGKMHFQPRDIADCFTSLHLEPPSSLSPFFQAMLKTKPAQLLKTSKGYSLERRVRDLYDSRYGERETTIAVQKMLADLPAKIPGIEERAYLNEALICFKHGAFRAAIIMTWNLAYDHFLHWILSDSARLSKMNAQLPITFKKPKIASLASSDDFSHLKEDEVLTLAKSAGVIAVSSHKVLKRNLDRRNDVAHPSGNVVNQTNAEDSISDLVQNVVLKLV